MVFFLRHIEMLCKCRHQLESDAASAKVFEWVSTIKLLGVENRYSRGQLFIGQMVVTHNKINSQFSRIGNEVNRFYSAVKAYDERKIIFEGEVNSAFRNTVSFSISMWYIKVDLFRIIDLSQKLEHGGNSSGAVNIIISEYKYFFLSRYSRRDSINGLPHIFHQPWVMKRF